MQSSTIKLVDLRDFTSDDAAKRSQFVRDLGDSFKNIGFARIRSHIPSMGDRDAVYEQVQHFFALDQPVKDRYILEGGAGQRGYTRFGMETAQGESRPDLKEFWHFGQYDPVLKGMPGNMIVDELPEFNALGKEVFQQLEGVAFLLLEAIGLYLEIGGDYFDPWSRGGDSILRAIHYPPVKKNASGTRAAAHTDINLITLLMASRGSGLEVRDTSGNWIPVNAGEDELIVNVGDMLSRLTNDYLPSTLHRVVNPEGDRVTESRYSLPFFMHPNPLMPLDVLEAFQDEDNPPRYAPITSGAFLNERLQELKLK